MAAPPGNKFWEARSSHGRKPKFASPGDLWDACTQYFQWVEDNPLWESKLVSFQGESNVEILPKMRAMTIDGLQIFLDISHTTWGNYRNNQDFVAVVTRVEQVIRDQKFSGAAAELLNPNIIARDLGLADKKDIVTREKPIEEYSDDELAEYEAEIERREKELNASQEN